MCLEWLHFFLGFSLVHFWNFNLDHFFCVVLYVPVCSLYPENLPFHLASKAAREQSYQCNLSRCGSEWIRLQEMVWDWFSRSLLFFKSFVFREDWKLKWERKAFRFSGFLKCRSCRPEPDFPQHDRKRIWWKKRANRLGWGIIPVVPPISWSVLGFLCSSLSNTPLPFLYVFLLQTLQTASVLEFGHLPKESRIA